MKWIGLTGGIATGKSAVAKVLREMGYPIVDADSLAREVVKPGSPGLAAVAQAFGREIVLPSGELNRSTLGQLIFADAKKRDQLEALLHPLIQELRAQRRLELERSEVELAFYDVPLLFEKSMQSEFDATVLVYANPKLQRARLAERNKLSESEVESRIQAQMAIDEKVKLANYVVFNETDLNELKANVSSVVSDLLKS